MIEDFRNIERETRRRMAKYPFCCGSAQGRTVSRRSLRWDGQVSEAASFGLGVMFQPYCSFLSVSSYGLGSPCLKAKIWSWRVWRLSILKISISAQTCNLEWDSSYWLKQLKILAAVQAYPSTSEDDSSAPKIWDLLLIKVPVSRCWLQGTSFV